MNAKQQQYLATADELGARLCRDAVWWQSRCNWLGTAMEPMNGDWVVVERALGPDLYGGTSGIALFLARLYSATGEKLYRTAAIGALNQAWSKLGEIPATGRSSFYSGSLGIAYARVAVAQSLSQDSENLSALKLIQSLFEGDTPLQGLDVISGSAGIIPVLLALHCRFGRDWLLDSAIEQGEHLLKHARKRDEGWSWTTLQISMRDDLTGFSHGVSGIVWALLELYQATGDQRWRSAAEEGVRYERRWFNAQQGNWADLRMLDEASRRPGSPLSYSMAWCHGAPGIALTRLRAWEILREDAYRFEAEAALAATAGSLSVRSPSDAGSFSLCHGRAGNAEAPLYAGQLLDPRYAQLAEAAADHGIQSYRSARAAWPCGINGGGETANLMLGLAGIGYFYLRMANPVLNPSVLMIHPQHHAPAHGENGNGDGK